MITNVTSAVWGSQNKLFCVFMLLKWFNRMHSCGTFYTDNWLSCPCTICHSRHDIHHCIPGDIILDLKYFLLTPYNFHLPALLATYVSGCFIVPHSPLIWLFIFFVLSLKKTSLEKNIYKYENKWKIWSTENFLTHLVLEQILKVTFLYLLDEVCVVHTPALALWRNPSVPQRSRRCQKWHCQQLTSRKKESTIHPTASAPQNLSSLLFKWRLTFYTSPTCVFFQRRTTWCHLCAGHICSLLLCF